MSGRYRYKFEGFKVGDTIQAYDFRPSSTGNHYYVIGEIIEVGRMEQGALGYTVKVLNDTACPAGYRTRVFVPYEVLLLEWNGRVTLVRESK